MMSPVRLMKEVNKVFPGAAEEEETTILDS
jgi:hypothetical protein